MDRIIFNSFSATQVALLSLQCPLWDATNKLKEKWYIIYRACGINTEHVVEICALCPLEHLYLVKKRKEKHWFPMELMLAKSQTINPCQWWNTKPELDNLANIMASGMGLTYNLSSANECLPGIVGRKKHCCCQ